MDARDTGIDARIRESFGRQGFMKTVGATVASVRPGEVEIELLHSAGVTQQHGYLHGAVVSAIGDTACGYSALTLLPEGSEVVSVEFKINFIAPAVGFRFLARGRVLKSGRTISICAGEVYAVTENGEKLVAALQATMMRVNAE